MKQINFNLSSKIRTQFDLTKVRNSYPHVKSIELKNKLIEMDMINCNHYYLLLTKNLIITSEFKTMLESLMSVYHLCNGVINCILDYVYLRNNKTQLSINYVLKIAQSISQKKILTTYEVMSYLQTAYLKSHYI